MVLLNRIRALSFGHSLPFVPQATDALLVSRYARGGDAAAFETLMRRHGPMVWGVCRRLLGNLHDAEDAFQATFLVLARKARSLRDGTRLSAWLHGVARRTALHLKSRRRASETLSETTELGRFDEAVEWHECRGLLDDAIARLPTKLRTAFLLCHAEGLTAALTAKRMNLPEGTVVSRVHRARALLKRYLAKRGITSTAGTAVVGVTVPETVTALTLRAASGASTPLIVASLAQGVIATMTWIKLTTVAVVVGALGLAGAGASVIWAQQDREGGTARRERQDSREELQRKIIALSEMAERLKAENDAKTAQLEALHKELQAVKDFLQVNLLAAETKKQDPRGKAPAEQTQVLADLYQQENMRRTRQKQEEQDAKARDIERLRNLQHAQVRLVDEINRFQADLAALTNEFPQVTLGASPESSITINLKGELRLAEEALQQIRTRYANDNPDGKRLMTEAKQRLEGISARLKEAQEIHKTFTERSQQYESLRARLKLREKLLLEVEERLLRAQLRLP